MTLGESVKKKSMAFSVKSARKEKNTGREPTPRWPEPAGSSRRKSAGKAPQLHEAARQEKRGSLPRPATVNDRISPSFEGLPVRILPGIVQHDGVARAYVTRLLAGRMIKVEKRCGPHARAGPLIKAGAKRSARADGVLRLRTGVTSLEGQTKAHITRLAN